MVATCFELDQTPVTEISSVSGEQIPGRSVDSIRANLRSGNRLPRLLCFCQSFTFQDSIRLSPPLIEQICRSC